MPSAGRRSVVPGVTYGAEATAFFAANTGLTPTQKGAIDTLVSSLKAAGLWTKLDAIYPVIGGTATAHKWNLKNPADTDGAFRIVFSGTVTHDANGMVSNGTTGFGDTKFQFSSASAGSLGYYSRTDIDQATFDMGADDLTNNAYIKSRQSLMRYSYGQAAATVANANSLGLHCTNRPDATNTEAYKNGSLLQAGVEAGVAPPAFNIYLMCENANGTAAGFSTRQCAFAYMTTQLGFSGAQMTNLYNAVQAYQTTLGRNV